MQSGKTYANIDAGDDILSIGLNRAVALIADKQNKGPGGRRGTPAGRELGEYPEVGGVISVRPGRFGPYVNHGKINATLPKGTDPETVTLEQAVELIKAKAGTTPERPARKAAAKSSPANGARQEEAGGQEGARQEAGCEEGGKGLAVAHWPRRGSLLALRCHGRACPGGSRPRMHRQDVEIPGTRPGMTVVL